MSWQKVFFGYYIWLECQSLCFGSVVSLCLVGSCPFVPLVHLGLLCSQCCCVQGLYHLCLWCPWSRDVGWCPWCPLSPSRLAAYCLLKSWCSLSKVMAEGAVRVVLSGVVASF